MYVLPILKNNNQRKEFIKNYHTWPVWIDIKETGERYYRYDLTDKIAIVVKVSLRHIFQNDLTEKLDYGVEQYYILGIKTEWEPGGTIFIEDDTRTFYECQSNKSALIEYLRYFQKKGRLSENAGSNKAN